jgi:sugar fermentation stimulation protein A
MTSCAKPGSTVIISDSENPKRKLRYTWELIKMGRTWVGVNTSTPNAAVADWIAKGKIPELTGYPELKREVKYGREKKSRIDVYLSGKSNEPPCYVEVKNATMRVGKHAAFPDAVTERGRKHLYELAHAADQGARSVMLFFIGRSDCKQFRPADEVDSKYGEALREVAGKVELLAYRCQYKADGSVHPLERIPVEL